MKIIKAIKNWYRGKLVPPIKITVMGTKETFNVQPNGIYIQSPSAKFVSQVLKGIGIILIFIRKEWRWVIPTAIAAAALLVSLSAKKGVMEIKTAEPCTYNSQNHKTINEIK